MTGNIFTHTTLRFVLFYHLLFAYGLYVYGFNIFVMLGILVYSIVARWLLQNKIIHEHFTHEKYSDSITNYLLTLLVVCTTIAGSPLSGALIHRMHHKYSDTEKDPHSPKYIGFWRLLFVLWKVQYIEMNLVKDYLRSDFQKFIHKHWVKIHLFFITLVWILDPRIVIFGIGTHVFVMFYLVSIINYCGHRYGEARDATELRFIPLLGWDHMNHHNKYVSKN